MANCPIFAAHHRSILDIKSRHQKSQRIRRACLFIRSMNALGRIPQPVRSWPALICAPFQQHLVLHERLSLKRGKLSRRAGSFKCLELKTRSSIARLIRFKDHRHEMHALTLGAPCELDQRRNSY